MSLAAAAKHIASKGRGEDSVLVHMTPGEVHGLQALALKNGGSLTINPETGLVEAGFLKNMLPMVAGMAMNAFVPGSGILLQAGAGALTAGLTKGFSLGNLAMGALGGYGGAQIGQGLMGAGTAAGAASSATPGAAATAAGDTAAGMMQSANAAAAAQQAAAASPFATMGQGLGYFAEHPMAALKAAGSAIDPSAKMAALKAGTALAPFMDGSMDGQTTRMPGLDAQGRPFNARNYKYDFNKQAGGPDMTSAERPWGQPTYTLAAAGGGVIREYAKGGNVAPRFLSGPGDGVSDSIPAKINGREPAKLADGEFVIPARIVSEIGNGSSKAGAQRLYAMMERVQKRRAKTVGKGNVAVDSKAHAALPA